MGVRPARRQHEARGIEPHEAAHFLNKLLFCLFAVDIGLLPKVLFTRIAERMMREPERFAVYVRDLCITIRDSGDFLLEDIRRFDGGLYESGEMVPLTSEELRQSSSRRGPGGFNDSAVASGRQGTQ